MSTLSTSHGLNDVIILTVFGVKLEIVIGLTDVALPAGVPEGPDTPRSVSPSLPRFESVTDER